MSTLHSEADNEVLKKPKIAFVISSLTSGGAERVLSTLANALVENYQVTVITLYKNSPFYTLDNRIKLISCKSNYNKDMRLWNSISNNLFMVKRLYQIINKEEIKIAIGFMTSTNIYTILACKLAKIPNIISERTNPEFDPISTLWVKLRRYIYPYCNKLVIQTDTTKHYYEKFLKPSKLVIIKNPISNTLLKNRQLNAEKSNTILSIGRLDPVKNHNMLIEAFAEIKHPEWKLQILGEGHLKGELQHKIRELQIEDRVELSGSVSDIHHYLNSASIFAFTSNFEGFPNSLIEAMAFGLPCVSTNCPSGPSEIITDTVNGFLTPVGDKNTLKQKLELLITNKDLRNGFSKKAIESSQQYETENISKEWQHIINETLND
ncbi:glycosyltransferase family 4 protein [Bizionia sp. KMM 8389]